MSRKEPWRSRYRPALGAHRQIVRQMVRYSPNRSRRSEGDLRDLDIEQAWLRVGIGSVAFSYAWFLVISEGLLSPGLVASVVASGIAALVGAWMVRRLKRCKKNIVWLRYLGIFTDMAAITIAMAGADEGGVPFVGFYLWVTVGNGFRYGPRYLLAAYWLSLIGYACLLMFVPFWIQHRAFSLGLLVVLGVVPLYVLVLLTRLTAQKDAAEQLSNAKSRFVANVSHELRTPLTGVAAVYDLLRARKMTADDRELVGMLGSAVTTLKVAVDAVLLMSKLEAGAETADNKPFNLWFFLQQLTASVRPQSISRGLAWHLHVDPNVPATVIGDQNHLGHVLGNLLNNAFKFTKNGSVTLRASVAREGRVRLEVIDTGIGIPLDQQERLFERFVQVDTSSTRRHGGTGLGTSIARDLVDLMGGSIGVISAPGQGSTFWVELPLKPASGEQRPEDWQGYRQVLVVSRNDPSRGAVAASMTALGLEPIVVDANLTESPIFDSQRYLAALLVMEAGEAATYAEKILLDRAGVGCPWLVIAPNYTATQRAALVRVGVAALLDLTFSMETICTALSALCNRLEPTVGSTLPKTQVSNIVRPLTILLADDNPSNQLLLSRILQDAGHMIRSAERGDKAFDLMAAGGIDVAILDLNMPEMSGPDIVKLYRASSVGGDKLPILILSADATATAKRESLEAGADEFLIKPVVATTLLAAIERVIAGVSARFARAEGLDKAEEQPTPVKAPMVDPERIQALRRIAHGDTRFLDRYISAVFAELEQAISNLHVAAKTGNTIAARDQLHIIEGTGASIGATALVTNCRVLRSTLDPDHDTDRNTLLAELSTTYALTKSTVLASLHEIRDKAIGDRSSHI
jgi:two-component system, sensor histidine kinase RpfC